MKKYIYLVIASCILLASFLFWRGCNALSMIPSNQLNAIVDSVYQEQKLTIGSVVFVTKDVRYTEKLAYNGSPLPLGIGSRGFSLDPNGKIIVGVGYDFQKGQKFAEIVKSEGDLDRRHPIINLTVRLYEPKPVSMDCRSDIKWSWSIWTGQPTSDFAYGQIESSIYERTIQEVQQRPEFANYAQNFVTRWYADAFRGLSPSGDITVNIKFENGNELRPNATASEFKLDGMFTWAKDTTATVGDAEMVEIAKQMPGNVLGGILDWF